MNYLPVKYSQMFNIRYIAFMSNSRLSRPSRSSYKHIYARTNAYKNSVIPYLARFSTNKQKVRDEIFSFIHS